jgi:small-conductance mechanosensitive channel
MLAVAVTALLLLLTGPTDDGSAQIPGAAPGSAVVDTLQEIPDTVAIIQRVPTEALQRDTVTEPADSSAQRSTREATNTLRSLWRGLLTNWPKYAIAVAILVLAWVFSRLLATVLPRLLSHWERGHAVSALTSVAVWLLALGIALSVLVGDIRALVGSVGLVGLALSWALQTPIESFTGWLLNSFHGYYRLGDRIAVGDVFGDVYRIDFLTTTVWEYGGPDRPPGGVHAEQPTGRMITFPNNEVLTGSIVNYTRDFPYVWDEYPVAVANESDVRYALGVLEKLARDLLGEEMKEPAHEYEALLQEQGLETSVADAPQVYASTSDWATNLTIRYLVGVHQKRVTKSRLIVRVAEETARPEHAGKIIPVYPRQQLQVIGPDGTPRPEGDAAPRER